MLIGVCVSTANIPLFVHNTKYPVQFRLPQHSNYPHENKGFSELNSYICSVETTTINKQKMLRKTWK
ncbi:hypothetical protein CLI70_06220 [Prevotella intermedia]|nr:hypothetical protein CLI70_06220 [Prevotella intermedia]